MDAPRILVDILVVLLAAKAAAELADRAGIPSVVGEILAGVLVGPSALGLVGGGEVLQTLGELGVILLLVEVGLEMDVRGLGEVGRAALTVALVGVVVPFAAGAGVAAALGLEAQTAVFVGAALTATSVGITARVFGDLRALATVEARTVLGAAVADDVLGLVVLTVVTRLAAGGSVDAGLVVGATGAAVLFLAAAGYVGVRWAPPLFAVIARHSRSNGTLVAVALAFALAVASAAQAVRLAPIVGAFVAGLALARGPASERIRHELRPVGHLLVPVFFLQIGIHADLARFAEPRVLGLAGVLLAVAVAGKLAAALGLLGAPGDRLLVGLGMVPRGEVGLVFATIGLRLGVLAPDQYAALLLAVLATTLAAPPLLRRRLERVAGRSAAAREPPGAAPVDPLVVDANGRVALVAEPPEGRRLVTSLRAARLVERHPPAASLLDWLAALAPGPLRFDDEARAEFVRLCLEGADRSWRLLLLGGVLDRALPELSAAVAPRRRELDLEPLGVFGRPRLDRLRCDPELWDLEHPERPLVAALALDAHGASGNGAPAVARRTARRLGFGREAEDAIGRLVDDEALVDGAARRPDGLDGAVTRQLAVHIGTAEQVRALLLLVRAGDEREVWEAERGDAVFGRVLEELARQQRAGVDPVEQRRASARAATRDAATLERIDATPRAHVLAVTPDDLQRQARRAVPPPGRRDVRVFVDRHPAGGWRVEFVARDRVGLLARETAVLTERGGDIVAACAATWPDRVALASYRVHAPARPDPADLAAAVRHLLARPVRASPDASLQVTFDDQGSPWYTRAMVEASDRRGLLRTVTAAFAAGGVNVHAARVATHGGVARDVFDLTARDGRKLDAATRERVAAILSGDAPRSSLRRPALGR